MVQEICEATRAWVALLAEEVRRLRSGGMPEEDAITVVIALGQRAIEATRDRRAA